MWFPQLHLVENAYFMKYPLMSLVENYAKKNRSGNQLQFFWPSWSTITKQQQIYYWFSNSNFRNLGACNIPLENSWKNLSNSVLHAPKKFEIAVAKWKRKIWSCLGIHNRLVKRTAANFGCGFLGHSFLLVWTHKCWFGRTSPYTRSLLDT